MRITRILQPIRPPLLGYSVAVLAVVIALGIKLLLDPLFEVESPFLLFFAAIMTSALYGGRGAGVFATVLAALISNYLFLSPTHSLFSYSLRQNLQLLIFVLEGLLISRTISALTSARQRITFGQEALSQSEERYRLVVESVQDYAIFILDPDGCIASWNIGAQNLKGYRADEIIGQHFSRFYPEEDIQRSKPNQLLKIAAAAGRVEDEGWRVRQDGSRFWASVVITALRDEEGNLQGFSKVTRDITKNKQAEEALRQSEEKFRLVAETLPQIVWTAQPDGSVDYYNQRWAEYSGILQEEGQGWGWQPVLHPDDEQRTIEAWMQAVQGGQLYECDHRVRRADGEFRWHLSRGLPLRDSEGRIIKWFGTATEIHEQKQIEEALQEAYAQLELRVQVRTAELSAANLQLQQQIIERQRVEEALRESERRLGAIFNHTFQFIGLMQPDGILLEANQTALNFGGLQRSDVIERPFWEARWWTISQETQNQLREAIAQAASGEFVRYEVDVLGTGNTVATIDFSIKPVRDEAGQVVLLIPEGRDITPLKQAEQTLRSFFDSASMMMGIVELVDNDILHISDNAATAKFFGLNPAQMRNRLASDMGASPDYIQQWIRYYREAERTQAPVRFDYSHITANGQRWLSATVSLIASFHNHPRFSYVVQDITDAYRQATQRKEAEAQIHQLNAELEQRVIDRTAQLEATNNQLENEIAERKQIEEALRQSEERFRQAVVNAPFPMAIHAEDGEILQINRTWMELTGYTQQEIPTIADWTEKAYGERQEIVLEVLDHLYELKDKVSKGEFTITTKQSTRRIWDFSSAPLGRLPDGRRMVLSMAADVTERKWAEEQLRTRTRQQEVIATLGQRALSGIDVSTLMDEATRLIAQTLDVEYCKVLELLPSGDAVLLRAGVGWQEGLVGRATVSTGRDSQAGYTLLSSEPVIVTNLRRETRFSGPPLLHEHNVVSGLSTIIPGREKPWGVLGAHTTRYQTFTQDDIHFLQAAANILAEAIQRQQAEATLQQQSEELAQANRLKDEFLATLSHELRTPLNSMLGWTKLLPTRRLNEGTMARAMETISRNTQALAQLIEDVLDMSDVIRGQLYLNVYPIELVPILERAIASIRSAAEAKTIQIVTQLDPSAELILGDANRLQQVFWNLLSNAVKFTPKQGRISVRLERMNDQVQIQVSDTGLGISADFLPFVFDRFRQENGSITRSHGGLGMGLAIVRYLVELQGGTVRAESPGTGQGATFTLSFPITTIPKSDNDLALMRPVMIDTASANHSVDGLRVLVVDDDADTRELLTVILQENGAQAIAVATVREALDALQDFKPHVLVSDIGMPEEDGYHLIRQIRGLIPEQGGRIPAVALTAYAREDDRIQALSAGFQMHIAKPIEPLQLLAVVASLASRVSDKLPIN
jgi:PAS domain S-box-containing protein